jgi:tRNA(Ile)-lysidine synthase
MDVVAKVAATIKKHSMLSGGEKVLVGLSGGPDSVCLTAVLKRLAPRLSLSLHALYIDHGLRPAETALGHTLDDQVETFFMRILRGSGMRGLSGIPPVRGNFIRPLIEVERQEIERFLEMENIRFVVDSSNLEENYLRNRLRSSLMPTLRELNPALMNTLAHTTEVFREEERYLEVAVTKAMMKLISRKTESAVELFLLPLETMNTVILRRILRRAIEETEGLRGIGFVHIEDVMGLIKEGRPGDRLDLPKGVRAVKRYSTLLITSEPPKRLGEHIIETEGETSLGEAGLVLKVSISGDKGLEPGDGRTKAVFDADKAPFPLTVRARKDGDFFYPLGFGKRKKIQDFFVDQKVPRDERDTVPVVTSGDEIVWVAGYRGDERFRASEDTKAYLLLEIKKSRL